MIAAFARAARVLGADLKGADPKVGPMVQIIVPATTLPPDDTTG